MMKTRYLLMMIIAAGIFSIAAQKAVLSPSLVGTWKYSISNVPPEYESGYMTFEQKENKLTGYVGSEQKREMQDLVAEQEKVSFSTNSDAGLIKYNLMQKGDSLSGEVVTPYGDFPIKAFKEGKK